MKAILLAAGLGTRLRPLTEAVPKCLVPIAGRPLLAYWLDLFERHGIDQVLINTHHLPEAVREYVQHCDSRVGITLTFEEQLLGSAGTLAANWGFVEGEGAFFIGYADNLTGADLSALCDFHASHDGPLTMGLFEPADPTACGIAELDAAGRVVGFEEKPAQPRSRWANAGLYVAGPSLADFLPTQVPADIGHHLLPRLVGHMRAVPVRGYLRDIGTWGAYERAEEDVVSGRLHWS